VAQLVGHVSEGATTVVRDFENAKTMDVYACRTTTTDPIAKRMARGDSAHRVGLGRCTWDDWAQCGHVKEGATTVVRDFENAKTMDIYACGTTTTEHIGKRMARGDSAHRVGPGRCTWCD